MKKVIGYIGGRAGGKGIKGDKGDTGDSCKNIVYRGDWVAGTSYSQAENVDVVLYNTIEYYCKDETNSIVPPDSDVAHWGKYCATMKAKELQFSIALADWTDGGGVFFVRKTFADGTIPPEPNYYLDCDGVKRGQYAILSSISGQTVTVTANAPCDIDIKIVMNDIREEVEVESDKFDAEINLVIDHETTGSSFTYREPTGLSTHLVSWGDGVVDVTNIHTYNDGFYKLQIDGKIDGDNWDHFGFFGDGRNAIKSAKLNGNVLDQGSFYNCGELESIEFCGEEREIPYSAFDGCAMLQRVTIPDSVEEIGQNAFENCIRLQSVTLGQNCKTLQENAFRGCGYLNNINLGAIKEIGMNALSGCGFSNIDIHSVRTIGLYAFSGCRRLVGIDIPLGVKKIPDGCFSGCESLYRVSLPLSIEWIGDRAFRLSSCDIYYAGTRAQWDEIRKSDSWGYEWYGYVHCIDDV